MERIDNEQFLACLPHDQSTLTRNCVAEQILGHWREILYIYIEIYFLDNEVIESNEFEHVRNVM